MKTFYVYILASKSRVLYIGVTSNIAKRIFEHKNKLADGFTKRYGIDRLVYFEETPEAAAAILREKQLKGWVRKRKVELIEKGNPTWEDISLAWTGGNRKTAAPSRCSG